MGKLEVLDLHVTVGKLSDACHPRARASQRQRMVFNHIESCYEIIVDWYDKARGPSIQRSGPSTIKIYDKDGTIVLQWNNETRNSKSQVISSIQVF